jgi:hypothetical protein
LVEAQGLLFFKTDWFVHLHLKIAAMLTKVNPLRANWAIMTEELM